MMKRLLPYLLLLYCLLPISTEAQRLFINEVSQGSSGSKEFVEFVVSGTRSCTDSTMDLRGIIFDDNPGWYSSSSVSPGCYRFANISSWSSVKYGSIIIVYNAADKNVLITAADDSTDANGDGIYILSSANTYLQVSASPAAGSTSYNYSTAVGGTWTTPTSASWNNVIALSNTSDAFHIIDPSVSTTAAAHSFSYGTLSVEK